VIKEVLPTPESPRRTALKDDGRGMKGFFNLSRKVVGIQ
jgi:hypothetical protein